MFSVLCWLVATILTTLVGPFGTFESMAPSERLFYWGALIGVSIPQGFAMRVMAERLCGGSSLLSDVVSAIAMAATLGPSICLLNILVLGAEGWSVLMLLHHMLVVFVVCLGVIVVRLQLRYHAREAERAAQVDTDETDPPAFLKRLDPELGSRLRSVTADNHYLHVTTNEGSTRFLMRFRDAVEELAEIPGYRVHRSHWVAAEAVLRVRPDGRRHVVELTCGTEFPVSRAYLDDLREAGLID